jgi:hypothetical protein
VDRVQEIERQITANQFESVRHTAR